MFADGAKLTNIFSTTFTVETVDATRKKKYVQTWRDNMTVIERPTITSCSTKPYTKLSFTPDYPRFELQSMTDDIKAIFEKRVYDLAASTPSDVTVSLNGKAIKMKGFDKYVDYWLGPKAEAPRVYEKINDRWEIAIAISPDGRYNQVSFVNGICTHLGGKHVEHITNQVTKKLVDLIAKKKKKTIKTIYIKDNIWVFVNSIISNPSFESQSKNSLTTPVTKFGSKADVSDAFIEKLAKSGLVDKALELLFAADDKILAKSDGVKKTNLKGIPKLDDAIKAGTNESQKCTLIITEGDSAKAFAVAGLSVVGRQYYGVVPVRGKPLNVREATPKQLLENAEFNMLKSVLGLKQGVVYKDTNSLRYGKICVLCDADVDGSHIKGLLMNLIHHFWPDLIKSVDGFITSMLTPIIKASKGKETIAFYTLTEYNAWKLNPGVEAARYAVKYFKGLGTSTAAEAKEYFRELHNSQVVYTAGGDIDDTMKLAFDKKLADNRKQWLLEYDPAIILEQSQKSVTVHEFVHKELVHFSNHDVYRSIPSIMDGFKPSQRKVLFGCFKRNLNKEIKVAQLSGAVAEVSCYHSGEASLQGTIIGMAQDFVGSNNLQLLEPRGQFGTRLLGGKDAASPRYIFTQLNDITRVVFNEADNALLKYLDDDGSPIEPQYYAPIIPMVLINGANGIGTGFSTQVACYNPTDIVDNLTALINDKDITTMHPWYRGFKGSITRTGNSYVTHGAFHKVDDNTLCITELPIGRWTEDYKEFLEGSLYDASEKDAKSRKKMFLMSYENHSTEATVKFLIRFPTNKLTAALSDPAKLEADLRLTTSIGTGNMHLYSNSGAIKKYDSAEDILRSYYVVRLGLYEERRQHLLKVLRHELLVLQNKARFVTEIMDDVLVIYRKSKSDIDELLEKAEYARLSVSESDTSIGYNYLTSMQISSFTIEKIQSLTSQISTKSSEVEVLEATTDKAMWMGDLALFRTKYTSMINDRSTTEAMDTDEPRAVAHKKSDRKKRKTVVI